MKALQKTANDREAANCDESETECFLVGIFSFSFPFEQQEHASEYHAKPRDGLKRLHTRY
jgi:hypothetical protein